MVGAGVGGGGAGAEGAGRRGAAWGHGTPPPGGGGRGEKSGGGWRICICSRKIQGPECCSIGKAALPRNTLQL